MARKPRETPGERRQRLRAEAREERKKLRKVNRNGFLHHAFEILAEATTRR
jgi:hypothetical protein